jgi:hypothetical protein
MMHSILQAHSKVVDIAVRVYLVQDQPATRHSRITG